MKEQAWNKLRDKAGFTLVELIVVIAILGILAGIGTVGYSGYIKRTNEGLDETLYKDIVYAAEIGKYQNPGATGRVVVTTSGASASGTDADIIGQWMANAFGSNWENTVKYHTEKYASDAMKATISLPATKVVLDEAQQQKLEEYKKSNYSGEEIELIDRINQLAGALSEKGNDGLVDKIAAVETLTGNAEFSAYLSNLGLNLNNPDDATAIGNAAVKYVAEKAATMSAADALQSMNNLLEIQNVLNGGSSSTATLEGVDVISSAALAYGIATGYLNSSYATQAEKDAAANMEVTGMSSLLQYIGTASTSENFQSYYEDKGATDVQGYLNILSLVNDYGGNIDITVDGVYGSDSTLALIQGILGN